MRGAMLWTRDLLRRVQVQGAADAGSAASRAGPADGPRAGGLSVGALLCAARTCVLSVGIPSQIFPRWEIKA